MFENILIYFQVLSSAYSAFASLGSAGVKDADVARGK